MPLKKVSFQNLFFIPLNWHFVLITKQIITSLSEISKHQQYFHHMDDLSLMHEFNKLKVHIDVFYSVDYSKGFGGKYGVQEDRKDKVS